MRYLLATITLLALIAAIVFGLNEWTQSSADYEYQRAAGQALIITAQGQARLDSAQATAITSAAMLPWLVVFCVSIIGTVAIVFLLRQSPRQSEPARIIVQPMMILPAAQAEQWLFEAQREPIPRQLARLK
jgi:uncharacterized membrane protein